MTLKNQLQTQALQITSLKKEIAERKKAEDPLHRLIKEQQLVIDVLKAAGHLNDDQIEAAKSVIWVERNKT